MLSGKWAGMADLAVDDQHGGELDEAQVGGGPLLPARQQPAEPVEPAVRHLDHPPPGRVALRVTRGRQGALRARLGRVVAMRGYVRSRAAPTSREGFRRAAAHEAVSGPRSATLTGVMSRAPRQR